MNILKKTFSKENVKGTEVNVLIIGKRICGKNFYDNIEEIDNDKLDEETKEGLESILKEFDISYDIVLTTDELCEKCKYNHYKIIFIENNFIEDNFMEDNPKNEDLSELINIIRKNNEGKDYLIIGLMNYEDKIFRKKLNENNVEIILYEPIKKGQIVVVLRNDFKWEVF